MWQWYAIYLPTTTKMTYNTVWITGGWRDWSLPDSWCVLQLSAWGHVQPLLALACCLIFIFRTKCILFLDFISWMSTYTPLRYYLHLIFTRHTRILPKPGLSRPALTDAINIRLATFDLHINKWLLINMCTNSAATSHCSIDAGNGHIIQQSRNAKIQTKTQARTSSHWQQIWQNTTKSWQIRKYNDNTLHSAENDLVINQLPFGK